MRVADDGVRPGRRRRAAAAGGRSTSGAPGTAHDLHPDLALLLSTSGSTGSPKLVRLSHAQPAGQRRGHRRRTSASGPTTAPRPRCRCTTATACPCCNSHLLRGAGVVLTDLSVVDPCFWELFRRRGRDVLRRRAVHLRPARPGRLRRPATCRTLRYVTQAGGRLAPERVRARTPSSGSGAAGTCSSCTARPRRPRGWPTCRRELAARRTRTRSACPSRAAPSSSSPCRAATSRASASWSTAAPTSCSATPRARPTSRSAGPSTSCAPATSARRTTTGCTRSSAGAAGSPRCSGCASTSQRVEDRAGRPRRRGVLRRRRRRARRRGRGPTATPATVHGRGGRARCGLPPRAVRVLAVAELPRLRQRQGRPAAPSRLRGTGAGRRRATAAACAPADLDVLRALYAEVLDRPDVADRTTPSSASAATRCPTSRCRCGSRRRSGTCRPAGTPRRSASCAPTPRPPAPRPRRWRRASCCAPSRSC